MQESQDPREAGTAGPQSADTEHPTQPDGQPPQPDSSYGRPADRPSAQPDGNPFVRPTQALYDPATDGHSGATFVVPPEPSGTAEPSAPESNASESSAPVQNPPGQQSGTGTDRTPEDPGSREPQPPQQQDPVARQAEEPQPPGQHPAGSDSDGGLFPQPAEPELGPTGRPWPELPTDFPPPTGGKAMIIAMCNQKGGVGKTTTTINLGASLVELGRKVLLVDFDPQGSLSVGLGVNPHNLEVSVYNLLLGRDVTPDEVIEPTSVDGMDILPSNIDLSAAELQLVSEVAREQTLLRVLEKVRGDYDVILVDCAPSLGLLTINALTAADKVLVPLECEFFALRGVALLTDTIEKVQERLNPDLDMLGILGTMYDPRTLHSREVLERVVQAFGDTVFHTVIRRTIKFPETTVAGEPITTYASDSPGAGAYRMLAREVLARCLVG
ncbi:chromosome partitioning protein [Microlunatus soli]|uniref:Chromosome partitioning protein n=1 Tax=Microlunatus soli TaxID=630515 RepID=A0A1H1XZK7_9ACTN|nr:chromosome partitioning protein [Microlunatus soli]